MTYFSVLICKLLYGSIVAGYSWRPVGVITVCLMAKSLDDIIFRQFIISHKIKLFSLLKCNSLRINLMLMISVDF